MRHWLGQEWRCVGRGGAVITAALLLLAAGGYALWSGASWARAVKHSATKALKKPEQNFRESQVSLALFERSHPGIGAYLNASQPEQRNVKGLNPAGQAIGGCVATIPLTPLAPMSVGQGDLYPSFTQVSLWNQRHDLFSESESQNPLHLMNGRFDMAFLIVYLYPLFILSLTYNILSREREAGTLALLAAQPIRLRTVALRRLPVLLLVLLIPMLVLGIVGAFVLGLETHGLPDLTLWLLAVSGYGAFWTALALLVNARGWGSATNALALATAWLVLVLVIPALLNLMAVTIAPVPSRTEYVIALRDARNSSEANTSLLRARYLQEHPDLRTGHPASIYAYWLETWNTGRLMEPVLDRYEAALSRQIALADQLRFLSPAVLTLDALNELSGTSAARYLRFRQATAQFQRDWHQFFASRVFKGRRMTLADYDQVPRFRFAKNISTEELCDVAMSGSDAPFAEPRHPDLGCTNA